MTDTNNEKELELNIQRNKKGEAFGIIDLNSDEKMVLSKLGVAVVVDRHGNKKNLNKKETKEQLGENMFKVLWKELVKENNVNPLEEINTRKEKLDEIVVSYEQRFGNLPEVKNPFNKVQDMAEKVIKKANDNNIKKEENKISEKQVKRKRNGLR